MLARARQDVTRQAGRWAAGLIRLNERATDLEQAVTAARAVGVDPETLQQLLTDAAAHHGVDPEHLPPQRVHRAATHDRAAAEARPT